MRALRGVFGERVEDDRGVPGGRYAQVLAGIGALETMRANDAALDEVTFFRMELWTTLALQLAGGNPLDSGRYERVLDMARQRVGQDPGAKLTDAVPNPFMRYALGQLSTPLRQARVREILSLPASQPLGRREIARTFWALTRACLLLGPMSLDARERVGRGVLHMADTDPWDQDRFRQLATLAAQAVAQGVDIGAPHMLAAFHLVQMGAFEPAAQLAQDGKVLGFNWSGVPAPYGVRADSLQVAGSVVEAPWVADGWSPGDIVVLWTDTDSGGGVVLHLPRLSGVAVPDEEYLALHTLNPFLRAVDIAIPAVFLTSGQATRHFPEWFFDTTGRPNYSFRGRLMASSSGPSAPLTITAHPLPGDPTPAQDLWKLVTPGGFSPAPPTTAGQYAAAANFQGARYPLLSEQEPNLDEAGDQYQTEGPTDPGAETGPVEDLLDAESDVDPVDALLARWTTLDVAGLRRARRAVTRPVTDPDDGRWFGEAFFDQADHDLRAPAMGRAANLTQYTQWEQTPSGDLSGVQRRMPVTDGSSAFWFGHGDPTEDTAGAERFAEFADRVVASGLTSITLVACSSRSALATSAGRLRPLVDRTRLTVHLAPARVALVPGRDGRPDRLHVDVDTQSGSAGFVSLVPDVPEPVPAPWIRVDQEPLASEHYPPADFWNVLPSGTTEPRFPYLYAENPSGGPSRYHVLSKQYEMAFRMVLSAYAVPRIEVVKALDALFDYYEPHFGSRTFDLFAKRPGPRSAQRQFIRLTDHDSDATLDERIDAFERAVFSNPDYPEALAKLWAQKPGLNPQGLPGVPDVEVPYSPAELQRARAYGHAFAAAPAEKVTHLMRVWRALNVPEGNPLGFRNALVAWGLRNHSLAEVLSATQKAGVRDEVEPSRLVDASRLHAWSEAQIDPRRIIASFPELFQTQYGRSSALWNSLRQPHERLFHEMWSGFDVRTRETLEHIATMAGLEGASPALRPSLSARRRRALLEVWERQGTQHGVRNLRSGHLLGLYLATGADRRLLQVRPSHSTVFTETDSLPPLPGPTARDLVLHAWKGKGAYPALFLADEVFRERLELAEQARQNGQSATEPVALIRRAVDLAELGSASVYAGYEELASEAAERLIPAHRRAWFGEWASGPVDGPHTFGDAQGVIRKRRLHLVSVNRRALLDDLSAGAAEHEGEHLVLYEVLASSAREVAPFLPEVRDTDRGKALYPVEVAYQYGGYRVEHDERLGLSYVVATLEELPQPLAPDAWDRELLSRTVRDRNGTQTGISFVNSEEWSHAGSEARDAMQASTYRTHREDNEEIYSDQEYPVLWRPGHVGWLDVHGSGQVLTIASRYGTKFGSGAQVGEYARQLLRSSGIPAIPIVYNSCSAAKNTAVSTVMAQELADWSGNVGFAAPTIIQFPTTGTAVTESGKDLPGAFLSLKVTADHPAPRFTSFRPRPRTDAVGPDSLAQQGAWAESVYGRREWSSRARIYEINLAGRLAAHGAVLDAARGAVEAAGGTRPATTDIFEVMTEFFERALPQRLLEDFDATPPPDEYRREYGRRGVRITREGHELPDLVFKRFAELADPSYPQLLAFRKAVVAWLVGTDQPYAHSLHEVVRASTRAEVGFGHVADAIAVAGDGMHLYLWADQALAPGDGDTRVGVPLPMNTLYRTLTKGLLTPTVTGDGWIPNGIVRVLEGDVTDPDVPRDGLSDRLDALASWRRRHRGSLLKLLEEGHITALHLLSGPDGEVFRFWQNAGTPTRNEMRLGLRSIVESEFDGYRSFPRMLMRDPEFRRRAREALSHLRKMDQAEPQQVKWYRGTMAHYKARTLAAVDRVAGVMYDDMPLHTAMAAQALTRLPSVGENVFWADREPVPLTGKVGAQPSGELHTVWVPELHGASLRMDVAMSKVAKGSGRIRVFEVERSRHAVDVSPIAWNPSLGQTFFRQETLLDVRSRRIRAYENEDGDVTLYEHVVLREVDELPRRAAVPPDATRARSSKGAAPSDTTPPLKWYRVKNADGAAVVLAQFTPEDWKRREPALRRLADGPRHFVHWRLNASGRAARQSPVAKLLDGGVVFYARHGSSEPADLGRMRQYLDLDSVEHVMLLECGTDGADDESSDIDDLRADERAERNRLVARALGKTVWWPQEKVAGALSPDGRSAQIHLHEDADGVASNMLYSVKGAPARWAFEGPVKQASVPEGTRYPSDADWNSGLPATTLGIGVRPILGTDASALLLPRPDEPSRRSSTDSEPLSPRQVDPRIAQTKYGISEDDYARFRRISESRNVVIDVLPGNPAASRWRAEGAMPKPSAVKAKSIDETDVPLGADPRTVGLIGFFPPRLPGRGDRDDATWEALLARYNERRHEYTSLEPVMRRLSEAGVIAVEDGVVHGVKDGRRIPMSGDEDIYDLTRPDGTRVSVEVHDEIIRELNDAGTAVTHGALRFWTPPSPFSESVRDKIVAKRALGGEPLVRFVPADPFAHLTWDGTAPRGDGDPGAGRSASVPGGQAGRPPRMRLHPYLESMRAAGSATFHDLDGTDWVAHTIGNLTNGGNVGTIIEQLLLRAGSFLGGGRPFQIVGGDGSWYDVTVAVRSSPRERRPLVQVPLERASRAHSAPALLEAATEEQNTGDVSSGRYPERKVMVETTRSRTRSRGVALRGGGTLLLPTHVPGLLAGATASVNVPFGRVSTTAGHKQSVVRRGGQFAETTVDVPRLIQFVVTVRKAGVPASSTFRGEGRATMNVPVDHLVPDGTPYRSAEPLPVSADLAWNVATADSLIPMAVSGNGSPASGRAGLFGTIASVVHPELTAEGSPGRDVAFDASTADGVLRDLLATLSGWVDSGQLRSKDDSVHGSYRYRATITHIAPAYDLGSPWVRSDQNSKSEHFVEVGRERGADIEFGPVVGVGLMGSGPRARAWFSPLFGRQRRRFSSSATSVNARQGADTMGARVLYEARVRLDFEGSGPLSPAMRAGRDRPYGQSTVTTWFSLRADEAAFLGLPLPTGLVERPLVRHPGVERALLVGPRGFSTAMSRFDTTRLVEEIEKVFARDERLKGLLPRFGPANRSDGGLIDELWRPTRATADTDWAWTNHRTLTATLSETQLRARKDVLFTRGVVAVLRGKGRTHTKYALVRVKGLDSGPSEYLGDADDWAVRSALELSTAVLSGAGGSQVLGLRAGATGKPVPGHLYLSGISTLAFSSARFRAGGPSASNRSATSGSAQTALHWTMLGFDVEITLVERPRTWKRTVTPGLPGRQSPDVQVIARTGDVSGRSGVHQLRVDPVPVRLSTPVPFTLTPRQRTLMSAPGPARPVPVPPLRGISTMYDPRWAAPSDGEKRLREWVHIEDMGDGGVFQQKGLELIARAAGEDEALSAPGLDPALSIEDRLSPGAVAIGLRRGSGVTLVDDLYYKRRAGSVTGALGQRSELINPVVIHVADGPEAKNVMTAAHRAMTSKSGGWSLGFATTVGGAGNVHPRVWTWGGLGGSYGWGRSESREQNTSGAIERIGVTAKDTRLALVQADLRLFQAAEVSVATGSDGTRSGGILHPRAAAVWMTVEQARNQGLGDELDAWLRARDAETTADPGAETDAVAHPSTALFEQLSEQPAEGLRGLQLAGDGPLGLGIPEDLPDFGQLVPLLKAELARTRGREFADALLPERLLDDRYRNTQRLAAILDRVAVPALLSGAMDGGVPVELLVAGRNGVRAYTARFSVRRGAGRFHERPDEPRGFEYGSTVSVAESLSRGKSTGFGLDAQFLPVPSVSGNEAHGAVRVGAGAHFEGMNPQNHASTSEYVHGVNVVVSADDDQVRLRIPFTATLSLYDRGLLEHGVPIASVGLTPPPEGDRGQAGTPGRVLGEVDADGTLLADDADGPQAGGIPGGRPSFLFRVPVADLKALAHVSPPRARVLSPYDMATPLEEWRSKGVRLPREAQANTIQGTRSTQRGLAALARQVGGGEEFRTTGRSTSYTVQEAVSTEWLTAAVPVLAARGLTLPEAHVPALLRSQDLDVALYARLTDGEVLGPVGETDFQVVDGGEAGRPALGDAHADARENQAGSWQGGAGWLRYALNDVYDGRGDVALPGEKSALASQGAYGNVNMFMPSGPAVLVQFRTADLRMVATLKRRLGRMVGIGDIRGTHDVALEYPVVIRMFRRSAAQMLADGVLNDPRGHLRAPSGPGATDWQANAVLHEIVDEDGVFHGLASYPPAELTSRASALTGLPRMTSYDAWHTDREGKRVTTRRSLPLDRGGRTFFWASPSTAGLLDVALDDGRSRPMRDTEFVRLVHSRLPGFTQIMLLPSEPGAAFDRAAALDAAGRIAGLTKLPTYVPEVGAEFFRGSDGTTVLRTHPGTDGRETGIASFTDGSEGARTVVGHGARPVIASVAHDVHTSKGRHTGRAFFSETEWTSGKSRLYPRLSEIREGVMWRGSEGTREYAYFTVPFKDPDRTFSVSGHSGDPSLNADQLRRTVKEFAANGATEGMVLVCAPVNLGAVWEQARKSGVQTIHGVTGDVAATPGTKGTRGPQPGLLHLLPGADGRPGSWLMLRGDGTVESYPRPEDLRWGKGPRPQYPDPYWVNGRGGRRLALALALTARNRVLDMTAERDRAFTQLRDADPGEYADVVGSQDWRSAAETYEQAVGRAFREAHDDVRAEAERATRAFQEWLNSRTQSAARHSPGIFARLMRRSHGQTAVGPDADQGMLMMALLSSRLEVSGEPGPGFMDPLEHKLGELGFLRGRADLGLLTRALVLHRQLRTAPEQSKLFLKALLAGMVDVLPRRHDAEPWTVFEILLSAQLAYGADHELGASLAEALRRGAPGMYDWVDRELAPTASLADASAQPSLMPPHLALHYDRFFPRIPLDDAARTGLRWGLGSRHLHALHQVAQGAGRSGTPADRAVAEMAERAFALLPSVDRTVWWPRYVEPGEPTGGPVPMGAPDRVYFSVEDAWRAAGRTLPPRGLTSEEAGAPPEIALVRATRSTARDLTELTSEEVPFGVYLPEAEFRARYRDEIRMGDRRVRVAFADERGPGFVPATEVPRNQVVRRDIVGRDGRRRLGETHYNRRNLFLRRTILQDLATIDDSPDNPFHVWAADGRSTTFPLPWRMSEGYHLFGDGGVFFGPRGNLQLLRPRVEQAISRLKELELRYLWLHFGGRFGLRVPVLSEVARATGTRIIAYSDGSAFAPASGRAPHPNSAPGGHPTLHALRAHDGGTTHLWVYEPSGEVWRFPSDQSVGEESSTRPYPDGEYRNQLHLPPTPAAPVPEYTDIPGNDEITVATEPEPAPEPQPLGESDEPPPYDTWTPPVPMTPVMRSEAPALSEPTGPEEPAPGDTRVRPEDLRRLRFQHEADTYERRLGDYLSEHPDAVEQMARFARITWENTPPAARSLLGTHQTTVPGAVGSDPKVLEQVAESGNFREQSTLVWNALRYGVFHQQLGTPTAHPPAISEGQRWRGAPADGPFARRAPQESRPPLSAAEAAFTSNGAAWRSGEEQYGMNHRPPLPKPEDNRPLTFEDSPHVAAQRTGGLLMTGISGTVYSLLEAAEGANEQWDAGLDLRWVRLALIGGMLVGRDHTLHELLQAAEMWANEEVHPERRALGFEYDDSWTRYHRLAPLSEEELRENVAVGGLFPDERVYEFYTGSTSGGRGSAAPKLSRLLPEGSWWRLFMDPNVHAEAFRNSPEDVGGHLDRTSYPGYRQSMTDLYREVLDGGTGRDWSRIDAAAYEELHNMATRHLVAGAGRNVSTTWSQDDHRTTMRGTGSDRVASDLVDDVLLGRRLLFDIKEGRPPAARPLAVLYHGHRGPQLSLDYGPGEAPLLAQAALDRYYDEVSVAADSEEKLRAVARVTRALQILQPFTDANSRVNVHTLMQKFLREQGFRPAVLMDSYSLFLGGYTVAEIAARLKEGMERFDQHVRWSAWDAFSRPQESLVAGQADELAAEMGITDGSADERRRQAIDTVRTARALFGHEMTGQGDAASRLAILRALSRVAEERHPGHAARASVVAYAREVFGLPSDDEVDVDHLRALLTAADRASAQGRLLHPDVLRDLATPQLSEGSGSGSGSLSGVASDGGSEAGAVGAVVWEGLDYASPSDGLKPLVFVVSDLAGGSFGDVEELVGALMPSLAEEALGGFRLVLRADVGVLGPDPAGLVSELVFELDAPVDVLLAGADGRVRLLRFEESGFHEDMGLVASGAVSSPVTGTEAGSPQSVRTAPDSGAETEPGPALPYRRTGPATAELHGTVFALHPVEGPGDAFGEALARSLADAAVDLPVAQGGLRGWAVGRVTETDLSDAELPPLDGNRSIKLDALTAAGVQLKPAQQIEAVLNGQLKVREVELTAVERFRLLAGSEGLAIDPVAASAAVDTVVAMAVARELGVAITVVGPGGELTTYGPSAEQHVLLVRDGDQYLTGTTEPGELAPPTRHHQISK
ncbi:hypothetical protein [Streptomyces sp. RP5T]|uniref:hypothetical protein n=1 Tax=Streptomyces sp. RP5T TaxID=2490848 RepID=UPI000F64BE09|nr:hypothetical protein [Streptomyces sp. RP5T]RRR84240.1 hypothetical protein EHS43_12355 [Streptomyces sp. RP5T]